MELNPSLTVSATCPGCSNVFTETDKFCQHCGFPLQGDDNTRKQFFEERNYKHYELAEIDKKVKNASTSLMVLAAFFVVSGIFSYAIGNNGQLGLAVLIVSAILAVIFLLLGFWCKQKPVAAIITGIVLYLAVQIINAFDNPLTLVQGIIIKVVIITYLIKGLLSALNAQKLKKELNIG